MLTKEPSSLKISMKMWENSVDAWKLTSTRSLGRVLIQIFTHTLSYPYMYTLQKLTILFINFVSFVPFGHWDFFLDNYSIWRRKELHCLGHRWKQGQYGEPSSAERWPCLLVHVGLRLFTPSLADGLEEGSGTKTVQATLGRGMLRQCWG